MTAPSSSSSVRSSASAANASTARSHAQRLSRGALRSKVVEAREELVVLLARGGEMAGLYVPEAADVLGDGRDLHGERMICRRQRGEQPFEIALVLGDQRALGTPLGGVAERVENGAAQAPQGLQQAKDGQHPGAEAHLARLAGRRILAREKRRREVEDQFVVALEHAGDLLLERAVGVQTRHFVFVLVRQQ